ncbi:DUF6895 family protein [Microbacterium sp. bgisy189]|uniref:DUF6895 family protein n=1 Tax=Microbacterium sp. bgisy189 TaxID=3413798 RepID=UPI003EB79776
MTAASTLSAGHATDAAVWPVDDLLRRVLRALDLALTVVEAFGHDGYEDPVHPELGFGPEKVVAEAAMLAYAAGTSTDDPRVAARVARLTSALGPLARSDEALADLLVHPFRVTKRVVPHVLLRELGLPHDAFDAVAAPRFERLLRFSCEAPQPVMAERAWIARRWSGADAAFVDPHGPFSKPFDLADHSREFAYGLTHLIFYVTDFGREPGVVLGRRVDELLRDVDALVLRYLDAADYDLVAELLTAWPMLRQPWSATARFAWRVLTAAEDAVGVLPCFNLDLDRLDALAPAEQTRYARAMSYHTALVMGLLCAVSLRDGATPVRRISADAGSAAVADEVFALLAPNGAHWPDEFAKLDPAERAALGPALVRLGLLRAVRNADAPSIQRLLALAERQGIALGPVGAMAVDLMGALSGAARFAGEP